MKDIYLKVDSLKVNYGDFTAISSATLGIAKGSISCLVGANGAGKTTLLNTIAGLQKPADGHVFFKGENISGLSADQVLKKGLCLVPQGGRCFHRMSVEDNLILGSYLPSARKQAKEALQQVFSLFPVLAEKRKQVTGSLSGGERQMVAIGRALMSRPEMIMFDELSLGLAPIVIQDLYNCIQEINRQQKITILLVEQDTQKALSIADDCFVILKGNIVLSGKAARLSSEQVKASYFGV